MTRRALELAALGTGRVSPSPLVGCVILSADGEVAGEGTYIHSGITHAEVIALEQAGEKAKGGTAYVSLEPHTHFGRTPPCTEALIDAGIVRVVCPIEDPNPLVSGKGFERLREAGIDVVTGILGKEAGRLNEKFICWHGRNRPFVHLKAAVSLDGKIATASGESKWITSEESRSRSQLLRYEYDAILVGAGTVRQDDPRLSDRTGKQRDRCLVRVILDSGLRTEVDSNIVRTAKELPTIFFTASVGSERIRIFEEAGAEVIRLEEGPRDLSSVLSVLKDREITSVLVEGGATVAGSFIDAGLVDKFTIFAAPLLIGGADAPNAIGGRGAESLADAFRLTDLSVEQIGPDLAITAYPA